MAFDYKKEYKEFYLPKATPAIVDVPAMNFLAVRGKGDPNKEDGEYKRAMSLLYGIAFTIKMSKKATGALRVTLIMSSLRWRAFGGRMVSAAWTTLTRTPISGSL